MKNLSLTKTFLLLLLIAFLPALGLAQTLTEKIDKIMADAYPPDQPGAVVLVQKDGKALFEKAYGMANMELGVKMQPNHILRLGSITKQFTAVAMLMLVQEGKVSLDDDLTKYLPDYPTGGRKITVAQLLNHTSGIKSYTSMEDFTKIWRTDMSVTELIDHFKNEPFDFEPGERWEYNNSAYILAGAIIEKASGMSYAEFLQQKIFKPLGMTDSYYDVSEKVVPRRVPGYGRGEGGVENAPFLSMTLPYAAGSLMSTVADLGKWDEALYTEKLVKKPLLEKAWTATRLNDSTMTHYGFGWGFNDYEGHRLVYHSGGINGFVTDGIRVPDQHLYVVCLSNSPSGDPAALTLKIVKTILGKSDEKPAAIELPEETLKEYVGNYEFEPDRFRMITLEGKQLYSQKTGSTKFKIHPYAKDKFFFDEAENHLHFQRDKKGKVTGVGSWTATPYGSDELGVRSDKPMPAPKKELKLDPAIFDRYAGNYELMPGFSLKFRRQGEQFFTQATGQPEFELFSETETKFFLKVVDAQVEFLVAPDGTVNEMVLYQGGQTMKGKRK